MLVNLPSSQVAEMHGELIEFNGVLQKQLIYRESQLKQLQAELVTLRGPVSGLTPSQTKIFSLNPSTTFHDIVVAP